MTERLFNLYGDTALSLCNKACASCLGVSCTNLQDTLFDHLVFDPSQFFHHYVYETGDEAGQKADKAADHPATDLQTAETLKNTRL